MPIDLTISEQLTYSTVRILCTMADGSPSTGTGFFFSFLKEGQKHVPAIVTNKHVVHGATIGQFCLTEKEGDGPASGRHITIHIDNFESRWIQHQDPNVDLCAMPIAPLLASAANQAKAFFFISLEIALIPSEAELKELGALEDILMIGYPNGIWDHVNNMPIMRRGITATHPNQNYEGRREFVIDAACFPGSSGSPVFLFNVGSWADRKGNIIMGGHRVKLLGVLYAGPQHTATGEVRIVTIPTQQKAVAVSTIPNNLGYVIKADRLLELEAEILRKVGPNAS